MFSYLLSAANILNWMICFAAIIIIEFLTVDSNKLLLDFDAARTHRENHQNWNHAHLLFEIKIHSYIHLWVRSRLSGIKNERVASEFFFSRIILLFFTLHILISMVPSFSFKISFVFQLFELNLWYGCSSITQYAGSYSNSRVNSTEN